VLGGIGNAAGPAATSRRGSETDGDATLITIADANAKAAMTIVRPSAPVDGV
jgi:hypothetical protein